MASHEVQIAKTAFQASLLRADPTSLTRQQIDPFFPLLESTITRCDRTNVQVCRSPPGFSSVLSGDSLEGEPTLSDQNCKNWVVTHVVNSQARTAALGRFLAALSKSFKAEATEKPSSRRKKLHLLYVVSDVLHHAHRSGDTGFAPSWNASLPSLVASAAAFDKCPKHHRKLQALVQLWGERGIVGPEALAQVRGALSGSTTVSTDETNLPTTSSLKLEKEEPFILPALHGDPDTPWYDQPAGLWLPHITPGNPKPMRPSDIKPIPQTPGPAPQPLVDAVKDVLAFADRLAGKNLDEEDNRLVDINELGERIYLDEVTGEVIGGETYYGWSRDFCEKMKARRRRFKEEEARGRSISRSVSRSVASTRSNSASRPPRRRERSRDRSYSREHSRDRSRDHSRHSPKRRRYSTSSRSDSQPRSHRGSPDRSRSRRGSHRGRRSHSKSRSSSGSRSGRSRSGNIPPRRSDENLTAPQQEVPQNLMNSAYPTGPTSRPGPPVPIPRPPHYTGPWPPPPPPFPIPPMGSNMHLPQGAGQPIFMQQMSNMNVQPPPPPPPPPPSYPGQDQGQGLGFNQGSGQNYNHGHYQNQGYGRGQGHSSYGRGGRGARGGGNTYRGRGRGGYDQGGRW